MRGLVLALHSEGLSIGEIVAATSIAAPEVWRLVSDTPAKPTLRFRVCRCGHSERPHVGGIGECRIYGCGCRRLIARLRPDGEPVLVGVSGAVPAE